LQDSVQAFARESAAPTSRAQAKKTSIPRCRFPLEATQSDAMERRALVGGWVARQKFRPAVHGRIGPGVRRFEKR